MENNNNAIPMMTAFHQMLERKQLTDRFTDTINHFASPDTKTRTYAAHYLAELGQERASGLSPEAAIPCSEENFPFFLRSASALAVALYLEESPAVLTAVREAIGDLVAFTREQPESEELLHQLIERLADANRMARKVLIEAVARYCETRPLLSDGLPDAETLGTLAAVAPFAYDNDCNRSILLSLMETETYASERSVYGAMRQPYLLDETRLAEESTQLLAAVRLHATQLRHTRDTLTQALQALPTPANALPETAPAESWQNYERPIRLKLFSVFLASADLSGVHLEGAGLREAYLEGANLSGSHLEGANLIYAHLPNVELREASLRGTHLYYAQMRRADLVKARMEGVLLWDAKMERADLRKACLEGANLERTHLQQADLKEALLARANLAEAHLQQAELTEADLPGVNLREAELHGVNLAKANLTDANLWGARLPESDCTGAILIGADLTNANLQGSNLGRARLERARVARSNVDEAKSLPETLREADYTTWEGDVDTALIQRIRSRKPTLLPAEWIPEPFPRQAKRVEIEVWEEDEE